MLVSILICTRNRLPALKQTMTSVAHLVVKPPLEAEVVVVDNGSTDGTGAWLCQPGIETMPLRVVAEARPGVGFARNAAVRASMGEILLFTDDDVRLPEQWIDALCGPILRGQADIVGGASMLAPGVVRPWMTGFHKAALSSSEDMVPENHPLPITISMAVSRRVFERVPAFDPELGPGSRCGAIEDILFGEQAKRAGFRFTWVFDAPVVHHPDPGRLRRRDFLRAAMARGRSRAYMRYHWEHWSADQFTHRRHAWEIWRQPHLALAVRWVRLWSWRLTHPSQLRRREGIEPDEFRSVNLLNQLRQFLDERSRPRNYDRYGLVKLRGILPDESAGVIPRDETVPPAASRT